MTRISRIALVGFSAEQMFGLVNDVAKYPEFLPGCQAVFIHSCDEQHMQAELSIRKSVFQHRFTTRNTLHAPSRIDMQLVDGPFKQLSGGWRFNPLDENACEVQLDLQFAFKNPMMAMAMNKIFSELCVQMMDAFIERAEVIYECSI